MSSKILLGVTGSVAAVLTGKMIRAFREVGEVKTVFTDSGYYFLKANEKARMEFIHSFERHEDIYNDEREWPTNYKVGDPIVHIDLRDWADILVIAPLSANTLAKIRYGLCDNLLTSVVRAWDHDKPKVVAPAMNTKMWYNEPTPEQIRHLKQQDWKVVPPVEKELACGETGTGAMAPVGDIVQRVCDLIC